MVVGKAGCTGRVGCAFSRPQDGILGFCYALSCCVHPGQSVVAVGGLEINQDALGLVGGGGPWTRRVGDGRQAGNDLFQRGVGVDGVLPYLVGIRGKVDLVVFLAVEDAGLFVVEIVQCHDFIALVFEEEFVGPDHLLVLFEPVAYPAAEMDDLLDAFGR